MRREYPRQKRATTAATVRIVIEATVPEWSAAHPIRDSVRASKTNQVKVTRRESKLLMREGENENGSAKWKNLYVLLLISVL